MTCSVEDTIVQAEECPVTITVSFGVSDYLGGANSKPLEETLVEFISKADQALYASKNAGRNRVMVYEPEGAPSQ